MKKLSIAIALISILGLSSCGGSSSGGSTAVQLANNAIVALNNITNSWNNSTCTTTTFTTCTCPGGGDVVFSGPYDPTMAVTKATQTANVNNCTDSVSGLSFVGTMTFDDTTGEGTVDFSTFGQCENFEGTVDTDGSNCTGTATGTCQGKALTCNWTDAGDYCACAS